MNWIFDKDRLFNWTVNPGQPGLTDFLIFAMKYTFILFPIELALSGFGWGGLAIAVAIPLIEEQARVTWVFNAKDPMRTAVVFALLISAAELVLYGRVMDAFGTLSGLKEMIAVRLVPTGCHFLYSLIVYLFLNRKINVVLVWLSAFSLHFIFNEYYADEIAVFMKSASYL